MTNWRTVKIGDCLTIKHGRDQKGVESESGRYPILATGGEIGRTNHFLCDKPSVLIGRKGTIDKPQYMETPFWTVDTLFYSEIHDGMSAKFLFYVFNTIDWYVYNEASGVPSLSATTVSSIKISIPELSEQEAIVEVTRDFDDYLDKVQKKLEATRQLKKGLSQQIFSGQIRFKDDNGQDFPDWEEKKLKDVLDPGSKVPVDTSLYRKITIKLHKKGIEFIETTRKMNDTRPFYKRKRNEIIIGKQNYFNGSISIVGDEFDGSICSNAIMSFSIKSYNVTRYLYEMISTPEFLGRREALANGTGQKELSEGEFLNFAVKIPLFTEQQKIANFLGNIDELISSLEKLLESGKLQKKWLLDNLVTGKIRLKEFRDE